MKLISKKYANKGLKIYDIMQRELVDMISDYHDIKYYIEQTKKDADSLERERVVKLDYESFDLHIKDFRVGIDNLESFRKYIKINETNLKKALENNVLEDREVTLEDLEYLYNQTQFMISRLAETMDSLRVVSLDIDDFNKKAKSVIENPRDNHEIIYKIMDSMYMHSKEAQTRIRQLSDTINLKVREGALHDIMKADAILKANIDLKKKKTEIK